MRMLKSRLLELEERKRAAELARERGQQLDVNFGSQIRSYVLHPYQMVKDLRTDHETGNAQAVLDGELDGFVHAYLMWRAGSEARALGDRRRRSRRRSHVARRTQRPCPHIARRAGRLRPLTSSTRRALLAILRDPGVAAWWRRATWDQVNEEGATVFAIIVDGEIAGSIQFGEETDPDYRTPPSTSSWPTPGRTGASAAKRCAR